MSTDRVFERQLFHVAALPRDVLHAAPFGERLGALQHVGRPVDADDAPGPVRGFHGQVSFAAGDVGHLDRRQQQAERARPRRPASARHELPAVGAVDLEIFLPQANHFLQPRLVAAHGRACARPRRIAPEAPATGPRTRRRAGQGRGDRTKSRRRALRRRGRLLSEDADGATRPTARCPAPPSARSRSAGHASRQAPAATGGEPRRPAAGTARRPVSHT